MWGWEQSRVGREVGEEGVEVVEERSREEQLAGGVVASLQAALLLAVLMPVYTVQQVPPSHHPAQSHHPSP